MKIRNKCVICESQLKESKTIKNFPVFMGATNKETFLYEDLKYGVCDNCGTLQLINLIPLEVLYQDNHNIDVVGGVWLRHNQKFSEFIGDIKPKSVLEIGDPACKLFKILKNEKSLEKWTIIEPNPIETEDHKKLNLINGFIDDSFDFSVVEDVDTIVMSHVFEHLYDPIHLITLIGDNMKEGTRLLISIPNMKHITESGLMPPCGLHFEHTFYVDRNNIHYFLNKCGFSVTNISEFENHSYFIEATKENQTHTEKYVKNDVITYFNEIIGRYESIVSDINTFTNESDSPLFLYGCHFPAQLLISMGLNTENIVSILDNSPSKIGKKLYGTNFNVNNPSFIKDFDNPVVICHMGPYTKEIKENLNEINPTVTFL